jgi:viroplasmin and RNaseH domain-containing protein
VVYVVVVGYKNCMLRTWSEELFMLLLYKNWCVEDVVRGVVYVVVVGYKNCVLRTWSEEWFMLLWLVMRIVC